MSLPFIDMAGNRSYPPRITAFTRTFWEGLSRGVFVTSRCEACDRKAFPPKPICPHCWSGQIKWVDLSSRGTLYSATTVHAAPAAFSCEVPYRVAIVDLKDGLRIATKIVGDPVPLDSEVEIVVLRFEDGPLFAARAVTPD